VTIKEKQKEIVRKEYISIAKQMILEDSVESVSVRRIAEKAGCSYATIYNYFKDINELFWFTIVEFLKDIIKKTEPYESKDLYCVNDLKELYQLYMNFFFDNPNIFNFFFAFDIGMPPQELLEFVFPPKMQQLAIKIYNSISSDDLSNEDVTIRCNIVTDAIHGKLLFIMGNKEIASKDEVLDSVNKLIDIVII